MQANSFCSGQLGNIAQLALGFGHTCARTTGGTVVCWGLNTSGQLGIGSTTNAAFPTVVSGLNNIVEITAGLYHTCARRSPDNAVLCWGRNNEGQLGTGSVSGPVLTPAVVAGLTDAAQIDGGGAHTCARRTSNAIVCWGDNSQGQIGDGTFTTRPSPTAVLGL